MVRDPDDSPFTPGFGNLPRVIAGRKDEFHDLERMADHGLLRAGGDGRVEFALPGLDRHLRERPPPS